MGPSRRPSNSVAQTIVSEQSCPSRRDGQDEPVTYSDVAHALEQSPTAQAYLAVDTARGERRFVLGPRTNLEAEIPMLDWRTSPIAAVFFRHAPGQAYELETGDRTTEGRVLERWLTVGR